QSLFDSIQQELQEQNSCYWICRGRSYLLELLCYLSRNPLQAEFLKEDSLDFNVHKLDDILLYIHTNYQKKITLTTTVENVGINRTTINSLFKKYVGMSFITYLINFRIKAASLMLMETGLPINEIAYRVGYEDIANFNRSFKKLIGDTPGRYRKEYSWLLQP
ncbi:MAG TPA: AraC family transcriptional regulator, partial [Lachnospiraceae bacterium]|nr:AraC family transcriptional regulator [Lachnospiraceae bacterium]